MFSEPIFYSDTKLPDRFIFKNKRFIFQNQSIIFNFYTYKFDFKIEEVIVAKDFFVKDRTITVLKTKGRWSNVKTAENGESRQSLWSDFQSTALSSLQGVSLVLKN